MLPKRWIVFCLLPVLMMLSAPVLADGSQQSISQNEAVSIAKGRQHGRILSATTVEKGGRRIHSVRILSESGRVRNLRIDARTGEILRKKSRNH